MKKLITLLLGIVFTCSVFSQSPDAFKYQALLKDASGKPLANQVANIVINILQKQSFRACCVFRKS